MGHQYTSTLYVDGIGQQNLYLAGSSRVDLFSLAIALGLMPFSDLKVKRGSRIRLWQTLAARIVLCPAIALGPVAFSGIEKDMQMPEGTPRSSAASDDEGNIKHN